MKRKIIDGDTGEPTDHPPEPGLPHCFIIRVDDDMLEGVIAHQRQLSRALREPVSRAAAARNLLAHALPRRRRPKPSPKQTTIFERCQGGECGGT
jgi:hypothetical protein